MPRPPAAAPFSRGRAARSTAHIWQRRPSPLSRYALIACLLIVVDGSLYPFQGWRDLGIGAYDYLDAPWPARVLWFDVVVNALGYAPLGFVAGLAVHPRLRGLAMVVAATLGCLLLSVNLEALQTFLPSRVASKVDVAANGAGALVGACIAARVAHALLDTGRLRIWRTQLFEADASRGLVLTALWFGALVYPDAYVLGMGALLKIFDPAGAGTLATALGLADQGDPVATALRFRQAETAVTALMLFGGGLFVSQLVRDQVGRATRLATVVAFVVATVAMQAAAHAFLFETLPTWPLLTSGARTGFAVASIALVVGTMLPKRLRWMLALVSLVVAVGLVNVLPDNPYDNPIGVAWTRGKLFNFYGLASGLNLVWPYLALAYLLRRRRASGAPYPPVATARASATGTTRVRPSL